MSRFSDGHAQAGNASDNVADVPRPRRLAQERTLLSRVTALSVALTMAVTLVSALTITVAPPQAFGAPGTPGVPQDPVPVFKETFGTSQTTNTPMKLTAYPTTGTARYKADAEWLPPTTPDAGPQKGTCNGWILNSMSGSPTVDQDYGCARASEFMWTQLRTMAKEIGVAQGMNPSDAAANNILSAATNRPDTSQGAGYMLQSISPLGTIQSGRFYGVSAWFAARNCDYMDTFHTPRYQDPSIRFSLIVDGTRQVLASNMNPCTWPGKTEKSGVAIAHLTSSSFIMPSGNSSVGMELYNSTASGNGNDAAFDTPEIIDMTPQLDQSFSQAVIPVGTTVDWVFTITNTTDMQAKNGWNFSAPIPAGLTVGTPTTTCASGSVDTSGGKISASGNLAKDSVYCTVTVPVTATTHQTYTSKASNITVYALNEPADASFNTSQLDLAASVSPTTVSTAGTAVTYTFTVTNPGSAAVSGLSVTASGTYTGTTAPGFSGTGSLGSISCNSTTIAAGGSTTCQASYILTQSDIDAGQVNLTAKASATASGATVPTPSNAASATVSVNRNAALTLAAGDPGTMTAAGNQVTFTFTVTNSGNTTVSGIVINRVNFSGTGTAPSVSCGASSLAPGAQTTCTGTYTVTQADITAQEVVLTADARGTSASGAVISNQVSPTVRFVPGAPDATKSTLTVDRTSQTVGQPVVATATIVDSNGYAVPNVTVTLGLDGSATFGAASSAAITSTTCVTNTTGKCTANLTDPKAEIIHVSATVLVSGTPQAITGSGVAVEFTAGAADASKSTLELDRTTQVVGQRITATATIRDSFGNPVGNQTVTLSLNGNYATFSTVGAARVSSTTCVTASTGSALGSCQVSFTDTRVESVQISATILVGSTPTHLGGNGDPAKSSPRTVAFTHGDPDIDPDCEDPLRPGTNLSADPTSLMVGGTSALTALITDEFCNPVPGVLVSFSLVPGSSGALAVSQGTTDAQGKAYASVTDNVAETVYAKAIITQGEIHGSPAPITFTAGNFSWEKSTFTVSPVAVLSNTSTWVTVSAGSDYYVGTLTARDALGNLLPNLTLSQIVFSATSTNVTLTAVQGHGDGTYTVRYSSKVASSTPMASVTYQGTAVGTAKPIPFKAGDPDIDPDCDPKTDGTNLSVDKNSLTVGQTSYATALITDEFCNPVPGVLVTFTLGTGSSALLTVTQATTDAAGKAYANVTDTKVETVNLHATITQGEIYNSPQAISFTAGEFSYDKSTFTVSPAADLADRSTWVTVSTGGQYYTGILTAMDEYGNKLTGLTLTDIVFTASSTDVVVTAVEAQADGTYTVRFSSKVASATPTAKVTYKAIQVGTTKPIPFKAGTPDIDPDCEDGLIGSHLSADPTSLQVGGVSKVTALVTDEFCNPVPGVSVDFSLDSGTSGSLTVTQQITDDFGFAYADLTDTIAETVNVHGTITEGELAGSPVSVTFISGDLDLDKSTFEVFITDSTATVVVADGVQSWTGRLLARDVQNNVLDNLNTVDMDFTVTPAGVTVSNVQNLGNGYYSVTYTSTTARSYTAALTYKGAQVGGDETISFVAGRVD
ncbi:MAG: Ig-like domain-containing protein, partial [Propionibacteriaceae bacterium]|nr:Ig-like domain-containing protein [Propionibacteriaceae bacterium]